MTAKGKTVNYRLDANLERHVALWLKKNPSIDMTTLNNMALRSFISNPQTLEPVEVEVASEKEFMRAIKKIEKAHAHAIEKLK